MQDHRYSMQRTPMFKLVLIGESGVGKTSLFMRIKDNVFSADATVGIESCSTGVEVDGMRVKFAIWDTAGVERFRTLTRNYYRNTHCVLLTCSLDDKSSLDNLHRWNQDVDFYCKDCLKVIVANKNDLTPALTQDQLQNFAATFGCKQISSVSAKTGEGVSDMLHEVARQLLQSYTLAGRSSTAGSIGGQSSLQHPHYQNHYHHQQQRQQRQQSGYTAIDLHNGDKGDNSGCGSQRSCCTIL